MNVFALTSDDALLLLEFEKSESIAEVAKTFQRDPSVISRSLKKLSETMPVLEKAQGKWIVTELGKKFNTWTTEAVSAQKSILNQRIQIKIGSTREFANRYLIQAISTLFPNDKYDIHIITFDKDSESLLLNGQVDMVFDCGKPYDPQIAFKRPTEEKMSLIISPELKKKFKIKTAKDLTEVSHIHYSRNNLAKIYSLTKDKANITLTLNDIALVREAIINGLGWGMLPTYSVKKEFKSKLIHEVPQDCHWKLTTYKFGIWWNRDKTFLKAEIEKVVKWLGEQDLNS
jgi:DNA-binding transcriptional LysR family regulator